jgi:isoleucyl-tRNA synthetase
MFRPVTSRVNFPQVEEDILRLWKQSRVFERSVEARRGAKRFVLYEGPPTANGSPGIHHVLARVFKDVIPRYKVMKGYYAPRIAGWDTHGLPVELEVEKELGFSGKVQIEEYGVAKFNARCRESVFGYLKEWEAMTERIAFWVDLDNAYVTMKNEYIETVWWAIKQMWDKGLVYQGYKVTPHCPRCGTSLSSHEVALGYQDDVLDPSVYIKFKVVEDQRGVLPIDKPVYLLAWTTTPWTLPGNTALAVAPDAEYAVVEVGDEYLILADALREPAGLCDNRVLQRVAGIELVDLYYEPLYRDEVKIFRSTQERPAYRVIEGDFVSMEEGTGIVHIAPAYGEIDFAVGIKEGLPLVHTVELDGTVTTNLISGFTPKMSEYIQASQSPVQLGGVRQLLLLPGAGKFVKDADEDILDDLKSRGLLFRSETVRHTYPFCWRCDSPLLYYAKQTWYIRTTAVKEGLLAGNAEINWYPEHIKYGRFGDWLQNNVDWAFSRERYWGTPLPIWWCESCGKYDCVGGVNELENKAGFSGFAQPLDLHRPFVDELTFDCPQCGGRMRRVPEVIDCWFDSGAMPVAQYHYPFENDTIREDGRFPADYICEAVDQTRGWFYSLHAISTLLFNRPCFKNVICLGHILDARGEKMSKARGNVVEPWAVIGKYGADALRWYCFTSSPPGNVRRFSEDMVAEVVRRFLLTLWNVYSFFVTYANIDRFSPDSEKTHQSELDRWIISELNQLIADVDAALDSYNPTDAGRKIEAFVNNLSNWYVRRSRRRFWKSESDADKLSAYTTLYECLVTLSKLLAPLTPFLAEEIYQNLVRSVVPEALDSVHLADFPVADAGKIDKQLSEDTHLAMKISSLGRAARSKAGIKVRQPLAVANISLSSKREQKALERIKPQVMDELNIKDLQLIDDVGKLDKESYVISSEGGYSVAVPTEISPELQAEGMAREIVHRLQIMRRSAGLDIADYITTYYQGDDYIKQVMSGFTGYIKQETLSRQLVEGIPGEGVYTESHKLSGYEIVLGVRKETS